MIFVAINPSLRHKPSLVLAQFRREAAKFFGLLKIINILAKFWAFFHSRDKPPLVSAHPATRGGFIATNTIDDQLRKIQIIINKQL